MFKQLGSHIFKHIHILTAQITCFYLHSVTGRVHMGKHYLIFSSFNGSSPFFIFLALWYLLQFSSPIYSLPSWLHIHRAAALSETSRRYWQIIAVATTKNWHCRFKTNKWCISGWESMWTGALAACVQCSVYFSKTGLVATELQWICTTLASGHCFILIGRINKSTWTNL